MNSVQSWKRSIYAYLSIPNSCLENIILFVIMYMTYFIWVKYNKSYEGYDFFLIWFKYSLSMISNVNSLVLVQQ